MKNRFREKYKDSCDKNLYFKTKAELIDTFPKRIISIVRNAKKPVSSGYIEFVLALEEFYKLDEESKLKFYNTIDHFEVLDTITDLMLEDILAETLGHKIVLKEWNWPNAENYYLNGW